jgi:hypothetical protein
LLVTAVFLLLSRPCFADPVTVYVNAVTVLHDGRGVLIEAPGAGVRGSRRRRRFGSR